MCRLGNRNFARPSVLPRAGALAHARGAGAQALEILRRERQGRHEVVRRGAEFHVVGVEIARILLDGGQDLVGDDAARRVPERAQDDVAHRVGEHRRRRGDLADDHPHLERGRGVASGGGEAVQPERRDVDDDRRTVGRLRQPVQARQRQLDLPGAARRRNVELGEGGAADHPVGSQTVPCLEAAHGRQQRFAVERCPPSRCRLPPEDRPAGADAAPRPPVRNTGRPDRPAARVAGSRARRSRRAPASGKAPRPGGDTAASAIRQGRRPWRRWSHRWWNPAGPADGDAAARADTAAAASSSQRQTIVGAQDNVR